jgi:hypothetical protein
MLGLQAVYRNRDVQMVQRRPTHGKRPKGAGHDLHVDSTIEQLRKQRLQFAVPHQWVAAHQGKMQGTKAVGDFQDSVDELLAFVVPQAAQRLAAAYVIVTVRITAGASQRTFPRNFDGKGRPLSL